MSTPLVSELMAQARSIYDNEEFCRAVFLSLFANMDMVNAKPIEVVNSNPDEVKVFMTGLRIDHELQSDDDGDNDDY